ncbi:MAG TPA: methyltransferase domain-containing protein [Gammaproteobacteria bacterium]|nr:methyltransferase domain-containing protein [Gammaproteobacteria bacterium]
MSYRNSHVGEGKGLWYDATHAEKVDAVIWSSFIKDFVSRAFEEAVARGAKRYLDFACGTGRLLKVGVKYFPAATGIDVSADMLEVARERVPEALFYCVDVTREQDQRIGDFDCVTLFRFLLNAEPSLRNEVLVWLAAHMSTGATLIGNNHMESASISGLVTAFANRWIGRGRNHLSRQDVEAMLSAAGFRVQLWAGFRVLPTVMGKPILGHRLQMAFERLLVGLGLGRFGVEQIFVARRV